MGQQNRFSPFFDSMNKINAERFTKTVEQHLTDEDLDHFIRYIEDFYGINDEEEIAILTQVMLTGYLASKYEDAQLT